MTNPSAPNAQAVSKPITRLFDTIRVTRTCVGDGLNDDELTWLLRETALPTEEGFTFLSFRSGITTLNVPHQDLANWYSTQGWITVEKKRIAEAIAKKYGLLVGEPPDELSITQFSASDLPGIHHHLELRNRWDAIIVAHPNYIKVRMFGASPESRYVWDPNKPVLLGPDLLNHLSDLYQP